MKKQSSLCKLFNAKILPNLTPPPDMTVSEWAESFRVLSAETSAEPGLWRTSRTPYLKEPMDCLTDPKVRRIVVVAPSQVGKTEMELNFVARAIDLDPGTILYALPSIEEAKKFSVQRIAPMIRGCIPLRKKVAKAKGRDSNNARLLKTFPGGTLSLIGSNKPDALASIPARYLIADERDRWAKEAGREGDPWMLAVERQTTFYNSKALEVSTPTIKGASAIEISFYQGTQEKWCHKCPTCEEWVEIDFDDIKFTPKTEIVNKKKTYFLDGPVMWQCPKCGALHGEDQMRRQPAKWVSANSKAYESGIRSFWFNPWSSPWRPWSKICLDFLNAKDDSLRLKVVWNTVLGKLWEERGDIADEDVMLSRREQYEAELPDGVLVLTCGVDTQDNRFEYEVVGHGMYGETWGIRRGFIMGRPDTTSLWESLDEVINRVYKFKNGRGLRIAMTMIDSGGHFTQEVYEQCRVRQNNRVFAIKGKGGEDVPYVSPAKKVPIRENKNITCWLYTIGVDAGKAQLMSNLKVAQPGAKYCHFPLDVEAGYNSEFFNGLLSEHLVPVRSQTGGQRWVWEKIAGHQRNEPLDCRNYALAALRVLNPDMDRVARQLNGISETKVVSQNSGKRKTKIRSSRFEREW